MEYDNHDWPEWSKFVLSELENNSDNIEKNSERIKTLEDNFTKHIISQNTENTEILKKISDENKEIREKISEVNLKMVEKMVHGGIGGAITTGIFELIKFLSTQHASNIEKVLPK